MQLPCRALIKIDGLGLRAKIRIAHVDALSGKLCRAEAQCKSRLSAGRHCEAIDDAIC